MTLFHAFAMMCAIGMVGQDADRPTDEERGGSRPSYRYKYRSRDRYKYSSRSRYKGSCSYSYRARGGWSSS